MKNHKEHTETPFEPLDENFNVIEFKDIQLEVNSDSLEVISKLSKTAMKLYKYIRVDGFREDKFILIDINEAKSHCEFKQNKSVYNALSELINVEILAGRKSSSEFYYNPKYIGHKKDLIW